MVFQFGAYQLDEERRELRRAGQRVELQRRVLDTLLFLARNRDRVVTREELLEAVWPGIAVSDGALLRVLSLARAAVGDSGARQGLIRTHRGRGYRFHAAVDVLGTPGTGTSGAMPLVGRDEEFADVRARLDAVLAGHGQLVLVAGEAGIGKTRLLEAAAEQARDSGAQVAWGRAREGAGERPYALMIELLRTLLAGLDAGTWERVAGRIGGGADALKELLPSLAWAATRSSRRGLFRPTLERARLHDGVEALLDELSRMRPLALFVDDIHAADSASLALLVHLAERQPRQRILWMASYRNEPDEIGPAASKALADLGRVGRDRLLLTLAPLPRASLPALLSDLDLGTDLEDSALDLLWERSGGNPLFLLEYARLASADATAGTPPTALHHLLDQRLAGLSRDARELIELASVAGEDFESELLERVVDTGAQRFGSALREAQAAGLLVVRGRRLAFRHALFRETVYRSLVRPRAARLHRRVGAGLEALAPAEEPPLAELAHHFGEGLLGGDPGPALEYAARAARQAFALTAFGEAVTHYEAALAAHEASDHHDPVQLCELQLGLAEALFGDGQPSRAGGLLFDTLSLAREIDSASLQIAAALLLSGHDVGRATRAAERVAALEHARGLLRKSDVTLQAWVAAQLAYEFHWSGEPERADELSALALDTARKSGSGRLLGKALVLRSMTLCTPERSEERAAVAQEVFSLGASGGVGLDALEARLPRFETLLQAGDGAAIDAELMQISQLADDLKLRQARVHALRIQSMLALNRGPMAAVDPLAEEALAVGLQIEPAAAAEIYVGTVGTLRRMQERTLAIEESVLEVAEANPFLETGRAALVLILIDAGRLDDARAQFESLAVDTRDFQTLTRSPTGSLTLAIAAEASVTLEDPLRARAVYALLRPFAGSQLTVGSHLAMGSASRWLGALAAYTGDLASAERHFVDALEGERRLGARVWEAHTLHWWARSWLGLERPELHGLGIEVAERAIALADELEIPFVAQRTRALLARSR